jgi:hypothetical protein
MQANAVTKAQRLILPAAFDESTPKPRLMMKIRFDDSQPRWVFCHDREGVPLQPPVQVCTHLISSITISPLIKEDRP